MIDRDALIGELKATREFLLRGVSPLQEKHSGFRPHPGAFPIAGQLHHVAETVDWFVEGAFGEGWDLDFAASVARAQSADSVTASLHLIEQAFDRVERVIAEADEAELEHEIPHREIMEGTPRYGIVAAITDHTAHHRGALSVYIRLLGLEPVMPYG